MSKPTKISITAITLALIMSIIFVPTSHSVNGNDWRGYSEMLRAAYIMGVVDDWQISSLVRDEEKPTLHVSVLKHITKCMKDMTYDQVVAIVNKYMNANPEEWKQPMSYLVYEALWGACKPQEQDK